LELVHRGQRDFLGEFDQDAGQAEPIGFGQDFGADMRGRLLLLAAPGARAQQLTLGGNRVFNGFCFQCGKKAARLRSDDLGVKRLHHVAPRAARRQREVESGSLAG